MTIHPRWLDTDYWDRVRAIVAVPSTSYEWKRREADLAKYVGRLTRTAKAK